MEPFRALLGLALAALAITALAGLAAWWLEDGRRLKRALRRSLANRVELDLYDLDRGRAAGLDTGAKALSVLWDKGVTGLVFAFDEVEGAELIVDGKVVGRVQRGETRRVLDEAWPNAEQVTLRLMFDDPRWPDFELDLYSPAAARAARGTPVEAVRQGRKWLAAADAIIRRSERRSEKRRAEPPKPVAHAPLTETLDRAAGDDD